MSPEKFFNLTEAGAMKSGRQHTRACKNGGCSTKQGSLLRVGRLSVKPSKIEPISLHSLPGIFWGKRNMHVYCNLLSH